MENSGEVTEEKSQKSGAVEWQLHGQKQGRVAAC